MHRPISLLLALATAGCSIDKFLEGEQPPDASLRVGLQTTAVTVVQGQEASLTASVTRIGDYAGPVTITVQNVPFGVTAEVGALSTSGAVTSATLTIRVSPTSLPGAYSLVVRGHADPIPEDDIEALVVTVAAPATYSLGLSVPALTIAQGGIAPATVSLTRVNYDAPVSLALSGVAGITAAFASNPAGSSTLMTVAVAAGVPEGAHEVTLTGQGENLPARTLKFIVTVVDDPVQLISPSGASALQASVISADIIVNRGGYAGSVQLSVDNLPAGVTASFDPEEPTGTTATMTLMILPGVPVGTYALMVRGVATGVPDAVTVFNLTVNASNVLLAATPPSVSLFAGASTTASVAITRVNYSGAVALSVEGTPLGVTVQPSPAVASGPGSDLSISIAAGAVPGTYPLIIRGIPAGWPPGVSITAPLSLTIREIPAGGGNVVLDWAGCAAPDWVAVSNGDNAWVRAIPVNGVVSFVVNAGRGGIAWVESGVNTFVRYHVQDELTGGPIAMCPPGVSTGPKTITGQGVHIGVAEAVNYAFGGATASSSLASPNFTFTGVREGVHDLVGFGTVSTGLKGFLRRDVDLPNGGSLGLVDLLGAGSFVPVRNALSILGGVTGETLTHSMNYLTTSACTFNPMYTGVIGSGNLMSGVPLVLQRNDDFHHVTVTAIGSGRTRIVTQSFRVMGVRSVLLPGLPPLATVTTLPGPYKMLRLQAGTVSTAYDGMISFRYAGGARSMGVAASTRYTGTFGIALSMPDFSGIDGWPVNAPMGTGESGTWVMSLDGGARNASPCTDGRTTIFYGQQGNF